MDHKHIGLVLGFVCFAAFALGGCEHHSELPTTQEVEIIIPADLNAYKTAMTEFAQTGGGTNPTDITEFITETITSSDTDLIHASAVIAAKVMKEEVEIEYFQRQDQTIYLLLNFHLDGFAGVSTHLAYIEPVIRKTLLNYAEIDDVVFDYAPSK